MKKLVNLLVILGVLVCVPLAFAADVKWTSQAEDTSPGTDSLLMTVDDPGGSPASKKATIANLMKAFGGTSGYVWVAGGAATAPTWTEPTGTGSPVKADSPTLVTPTLGTPAGGTLTNCDGLPLASGVSGQLPIANGGTGQATAADAFAALKQDASDSATGVVELATDAETVTGAATDKVATPANITAKLAAPGEIGGTTPAAGNFSSLDVTGTIAVDDANGGAIVDEAASDTNPTNLPDKSDTDTGIGTSAADQLSLIAGGVEGARVSEGTVDHFIIKVGEAVSTESVTCGDGTNTGAYSDGVVSSYYATDNDADGADVVTMTDGTVAGERRTIVLKTDNGDDLQITPTNFANGTSITLDEAGESVSLEWDGANWFIIGHYGATVSS